MEKMENITSLQDIIEITYKSTNLKKIIILGIPEVMEEDLIIQKLEGYYNPETSIEIFKKITRNNKYQLILEVEDFIAAHLLK